jgi:glutamate-1-semialdehyde 2,1-aminomutase
VFAGECSLNGVYLAPRHNWFISAAHTEEDIKQTLEVTERAFAAVHRQFA